VWLDEGRELLADIRSELTALAKVITHEDWWGEEGLPFEQPRP